MIFMVYGTRAEYIKIFPLIMELQKTNDVYTIVLSQHEEQLQDTFTRYPHLPPPDLWLVHGFRDRDLTNMYEAPLWFCKVMWAMIRATPTVRKHADKPKSRNIVLVHGDTFTTVWGAIWGRLLGYKVGHIEAGLRSFKIFHPFPEELDRKIVSTIARVHYAPGKVPAANLVKAKVKGRIVNTGYNTNYDAINYSSKHGTFIPNLPKKYGFITIHRSELLLNRPVFEQLMKTLSKYAAKTPLVMLEEPKTAARLKEWNLEHLTKPFTYLPKLDLLSFAYALSHADYVVTDSGGLQEECAYLGIPCLVHRMATERTEGLEEGSVKLDYYKDDVLRDFLDNPDQLSRQAIEPDRSPTQIILDDLAPFRHSKIFD
jgi:UDP-N-acetylglucosamine 2-epimerase (non-hydrolysing)